MLQRRPYEKLLLKINSLVLKKESLEVKRIMRKQLQKGEQQMRKF